MNVQQMETSPSLRELRAQAATFTIDVQNSVALADYYALARQLCEQLSSSTSSRGAYDDNRVYLDLKTFLALCAGITKHNAQNSQAFAKDKLWLKREYTAKIDLLEAAAHRIVAREESERRLHEDLFDLFDGGSEGATEGDDSTATSSLHLDQCLQILSIDASASQQLQLQQKQQKQQQLLLPAARAPPVANFDSLRTAKAQPPPSALSAAAAASPKLVPYPDIIALTATSPSPSYHSLPSAPSAPSQTAAAFSSPSSSSSASASSSAALPPPPYSPRAFTSTSTSIPTPLPLPLPAPASPVDRAILQHLSPHALHCTPLLDGLQPFVSQFELRFSSSPGPGPGPGPAFCQYFRRFDHHVSFLPFLRTLPPGLQITREAQETNRCFFLHLGLATKIHPFALQVALRNMAAQLLPALPADSPALDIIPTVCDYAGFVDANSLCYLWPDELDAYRICLISGTASTGGPMFSTFSSSSTTNAAGASTVDIIIHCDGSHFTLLQPLVQRGAPRFSLSLLLHDASRAGCVVQVCNNCTNLGRVKSLRASLAQIVDVNL